MSSRKIDDQTQPMLLPGAAIMLIEAETALMELARDYEYFDRPQQAAILFCQAYSIAGLRESWENKFNPDGAR